MSSPGRSFTASTPSRKRSPPARATACPDLDSTLAEADDRERKLVLARGNVGAAVLGVPRPAPRIVVGRARRPVVRVPLDLIGSRAVVRRPERPVRAGHVRDEVRPGDHPVAAAGALEIS